MSSYFQLSMPRRQAQRRKIPTSYAHVLIPRGHRDLHFIALCEDSTSYSGGCVLYLSRAVYVYPLESQTADNAIGMYPLPSW